MVSIKPVWKGQTCYSPALISGRVVPWNIHHCHTCNETGKKITVLRRVQNALHSAWLSLLSYFPTGNIAEESQNVLVVAKISLFLLYAVMNVIAQRVNQNCPPQSLSIVLSMTLGPDSLLHRAMCRHLVGWEVERVKYYPSNLVGLIPPILHWCHWKAMETQGICVVLQIVFS